MKQFIFMVFCLIVCTQCQENPSEGLITPPSPDQIAIEGVIQNYFDGWLTGDTTLVGSAMHKSCHLKFVRNDTIWMRNRT